MLGTPLNVIVGHAELLDNDRATRAAIHASSMTILAQAAKMTTIIRGLLDFSRRGGTEQNDVDVNALAHAAAALLKPIASKRAVEIVVEVEATGAVVHGNRMDLEQVLVNVMMNGIRAMRSGGAMFIRVHEAQDEAPASRASTSSPSHSSEPPPHRSARVEPGRRFVPRAPRPSTVTVVEWRLSLLSKLRPEDVGVRRR